MGTLLRQGGPLAVGAVDAELELRESDPTPGSYSALKRSTLEAPDKA